MARKKVDCDWRLFEFSLEELGIGAECLKDDAYAPLGLECDAVRFEQNDHIRGNDL